MKKDEKFHPKLQLSVKWIFLIFSKIFKQNVCGGVVDYYWVWLFKIAFNNKMKKEYSFKGNLPTMAEQDNRHSYGSSKYQRDSWTDMRV